MSIDAPAGTSHAAEQDGFTLVEVLIASVLGLIVMGAAVMVFTASIQSQPRVATRSAQIQQARTAMENLTRELRQASSVTSQTSQGLSMVTWVNSVSCGGAHSANSIQCRVTYTCTAGICTRTEASTSGTGGSSSRRVVEGLASTNVFAYTSVCPTPTSAGEDSISLTDAVSLRNVGEAGIGYVCVGLVFPGPS
jgi:prepilin-type N-terminal cleavage/methylation domain-containing protein